MRCTMRRADRPEGVFQKGEEFLHAVAELQARQLKRIGKVAHVLAGGCQQIHPRAASSVALACEREPPSPTMIPSYI